MGTARARWGCLSGAPQQAHKGARQCTQPFTRTPHRVLAVTQSRRTGSQIGAAGRRHWVRCHGPRRWPQARARVDRHLLPTKHVAPWVLTSHQPLLPQHWAAPQPWPTSCCCPWPLALGPAHLPLAGTPKPMCSHAPAPEGLGPSHFLTHPPSAPADQHTACTVPLLLPPNPAILQPSVQSPSARRPLTG